MNFTQADWKKHVANNHVPHRRDCAVRLGPHRGVVHLDVYCIKADIAGTIRVTGKDPESRSLAVSYRCPRLRKRKMELKGPESLRPKLSRLQNLEGFAKELIEDDWDFDEALWVLEEEEEEEEEEDGLSENIFFGSCGFQTRKKVSSCAYSGLTTGTRVTRARFTSHTPQAELLLDGLQEPLRVVHTVDPRDADQCIEKRMLSIHTKIGVIENAALRLPPAEVCSGGFVLSQQAYAEELLRVNHVKPTALGKVACQRELVFFDTILTDEFPSEETVRTTQSLTGEILWISLCTWPDLAFAACVFASLSTKALQRAIRIAEKALAYVLRTTALALTGDVDETGLIAYSDASYAPEGNRSHTGWVVFFHGIEQLKDILDEWSRGRPDGSEISRVAIIRTEKVQILKDILASWEDGGEESDASELSDSAPSDSGDDGSDAASVDEGDAAEGEPELDQPSEPKNKKTRPPVPVFEEPAAMAEGSPDELTALELQEVEAEAPPEDDDMDHGRSSEQDSFRGEMQRSHRNRKRRKTLAAVAVAVVVVAVEGDEAASGCKSLKEGIKYGPMLPKLEKYKVMPYWNRREVGVCLKPTTEAMLCELMVSRILELAAIWGLLEHGTARLTEAQDCSEALTVGTSVASQSTNDDKDLSFSCIISRREAIHAEISAGEEAASSQSVAAAPRRAHGECATRCIRWIEDGSVEHPELMAFIHWLRWRMSRSYGIFIRRCFGAEAQEEDEDEEEGGEPPEPAEDGDLEEVRAEDRE
ncbi:hypothetical protein AK812_SmicGene41930 [Symbiodinium microadriaticum]|uniref:Uncharacterized protein n=1 Tax=Symbiodinium microadriaticum TaxID=2951 RepID=A0A1Q9C4W1_SYMMI|nr:hypothetical protein AK812_SmicGene41930 [Symbiodinium microadriaticum]